MRSCPGKRWRKQLLGLPDLRSVCRRTFSWICNKQESSPRKRGVQRPPWAHCTIQCISVWNVRCYKWDKSHPVFHNSLSSIDMSSQSCFLLIQTVVSHVISREKESKAYQIRLEKGYMRIPWRLRTACLRRRPFLLLGQIWRLSKDRKRAKK